MCQTQLASIMSYSLYKQASHVLLYSTSDMLLTETIKALENQNTSNNFLKPLCNECIMSIHSDSNKDPYSNDVLSKETI